LREPAGARFAEEEADLVPFPLDRLGPLEVDRLRGVDEDRFAGGFGMTSSGTTDVTSSTGAASADGAPGAAAARGASVTAAATAGVSPASASDSTPKGTGALSFTGVSSTTGSPKSSPRPAVSTSITAPSVSRYMPTFGEDAPRTHPV
jgi:hypothetical protein